ncbi:nuclear cap-binding complex large subunit [Schizosaccharomyces cryophilus OY26]|uniref:Nuclear cap-binding complex large subunit n=1 Tax=Schizosaccharomyces cryophilus (strain OY26 / ATCC MYA-4695 / CBS 11777 / NBRC 106824 / NRRL Y48691) TaxID=653667 RepID=S9X512_SCHCR|nr:nuclear cap-binding complex large subunit [Schizosaccharomyces cryophilus OY26]EPY52172.1 nuclear cap-binding complex large subunit [Schizosaccharomyces cryophilus OY26]
MSSFHTPIRSRKRGREESDSGFRPNRANPQELLGFRIKKDITFLADPRVNPVVTEDINYVAMSVSRESHEEESVSAILNCILETALSIPVKVAHLATLMMRAALKAPLLVERGVDILQSKLTVSLEQFDYYQAKIVFRLLICLSRIYESEGVEPVFSKFLDKLSEQTTPSIFGDQILKIILINIPYYCTASKHPDRNTLVGDWIQRCASYVESRKPLLQQVKNPFSNSEEYVEEELDLLFRQTILEKENGLQFSYLPRPWEAFESDLAQVSPVSLKTFEWNPSITEEQLKPPYFRPFVELFHTSEIRTTPETLNIASSIFRDVTADIINHLEYNRMEAAQILTDLDVYFTYKTFALRGTPVGELPKLDPEESRWKVEDIVTEAIFSELLTTAKPAFKPIYYHSLLTECCRVAPKILAPTFGRIIRFVFNISENLPLETFEKFIDWFSHHLSNFNFFWKWQEWIGNMELEDFHPKKVFMRETISKELELSYWSRIHDSLPEPLRQLMTAEPPKPEIPYENESHPLHASFKEITDHLRIHKPIEVISSALSSVEENKASETSGVRFLMACNYSLGSKSLSHALNAFEKHLDVIKHFSRKSLSTEMETIDELFLCWRLQPSIAVIWLGKMLNYSIVSLTSVFRWLLDQKDPSIWAKSWTWSLMHMSLKKMDARLENVNSDDENLKELIRESKEEKEAVLNLLFTELPKRKSENESIPWLSHWIQLIQNDLESVYGQTSD